MQPIVTDGVVWSVCVSVCWSHLWALQKQLNRLKSHLLLIWVGLMKHVLHWGYSWGNGQVVIFGGCMAHWKRLWVTAAQQQKSVTASAQLLQLTALYPAGRCHINCPMWKIPPLRQGGLLWKLFDHLFYFVNISYGEEGSHVSSHNNSTDQRYPVCTPVGQKSCYDRYQDNQVYQEWWDMFEPNYMCG